MKKKKKKTGLIVILEFGLDLIVHVIIASVLITHLITCHVDIRLCLI